MNITLVSIKVILIVYGNRKGIAIYYSNMYELVQDICKQNYQISKIKLDNYDVICVYRSTDSVISNQINFLQDLNNFINLNKKTFILGDFDFDAMAPVVRDRC